MITHYLDQLMGAYFNQDYDLFGETIEEVMNEYLKCEGPEHAKGLIADCHHFLQRSDDIETAFLDLYGFDFDPALWGMTARQFLTVVSAHTSCYLEM